MKADTDQRTGPMGRMAGRLGKAGPAVGASIVRSRLFIKYVALLVAVVVLALLANGAFEIWFSYQEHKASLIGIQREQAEGAAENRAVHHRDRKPGRLDHAIAVVGRHARSAPLRRAAAVAPGAGHHRARPDRCLRPRAAARLAAHHGRGRQRHRLFREAGIHRGRGAQGLLRPGLFPPQVRALHDAVARRHAARYRREHRRKSISS